MKIINGTEFIYDDDKIVDGDYFLDIDATENHIYLLDDDYDAQKEFYWKAKNVDVIVFNKNVYECNAKMSNYKKIDY